ncbi:unnamed protein product [Cyprideis torosa]|uniref:Uncharacterized protein n=1 Tax=Cyprideis torosa TaxID=163714 RepID=A0A7R8ZQ81_9CRUS|nr:unnamed protein product [Cyprideis torosa]CAG0895688.1 unnamed protein product [Cyprideis torosa]
MLKLQKEEKWGTRRILVTRRALGNSVTCVRFVVFFVSCQTEFWKTHASLRRSGPKVAEKETKKKGNVPAGRSVTSKDVHSEDSENEDSEEEEIQAIIDGKASDSVEAVEADSTNSSNNHPFGSLSAIETARELHRELRRKLKERSDSSRPESLKGKAGTSSKTKKKSTEKPKPKASGESEKRRKKSSDHSASSKKTKKSADQSSKAKKGKKGAAKKRHQRQKSESDSDSSESSSGGPWTETRQRSHRSDYFDREGKTVPNTSRVNFIVRFFGFGILTDIGVLLKVLILVLLNVQLKVFDEFRSKKNLENSASRQTSFSSQAEEREQQKTAASLVLRQGVSTATATPPSGYLPTAAVFYTKEGSSSKRSRRMSSEEKPPSYPFFPTPGGSGGDFGHGSCPNPNNPFLAPGIPFPPPGFSPAAYRAMMSPWNGPAQGHGQMAGPGMYFRQWGPGQHRFMRSGRNFPPRGQDFAPQNSFIWNQEARMPAGAKADSRKSDRILESYKRYRPWVQLRTEDELRSSAFFRLKMMSFNVLAQDLLEGHRFLYKFCTNEDLTWEVRRERIFQAIKEADPTVLCMQEIQDIAQENDFRPVLTELGYDGLFIERPHLDFFDGVAIYWKKSDLSLVDSECFTYFKSEAEFGSLGLGREGTVGREGRGLCGPCGGCGPPEEKKKTGAEGAQRNETNRARKEKEHEGIPRQIDFVVLVLDLKLADSRHLNRHNVGIVARFRVPGTGLEFCVGTTHLLFNPKRHDVRLAQTQMLLAHLDDLAMEDDGGYTPVFVCGDLNFGPDNPVYSFLRNGSLDVSSVEPWSNDSDGWIPPSVGLSDCSRFERTMDRRKQGPPIYNSGLLSHGFHLASACPHFKNEREVGTTRHRGWCTVDYIFHRSKFKGCCAKRSPQRLIEMAETKMDIEEPSLEPPRSQSETAVKEEAAEATDETGTSGHQQSKRTKRKSKKIKKEPVHYDCAVCGRRFKGRYNLKDHERVHSGERPYSCEWCSKSFSQLVNLEVHLRRHTGDKPFKCTNCHKRFTSGSDLKVHARSQTKERPHECNVCSKRFSQASHLQRHVRIHTGENPFQCLVCGKGFKSRYELRIHARTHTKERPYECNVCSKSFSQAGHLQTHVRIHSGENPFQCLVCGKGFKSRYELRIHARTHTKERPYEWVHEVKQFEESRKGGACWGVAYR